MTEVIAFDQNTGSNIAAYIKKPMLKTRDYFNQLGIKIDQQTQLNFRLLGKRNGNKSWKTYSLRTLHPSWQRADGSVVVASNSWNKRPGTDGNKSRKYSSSSRMLQASGGFKSSFSILETRQKGMKYGSRMKLAKDIMSNPSRPVVFVDNKDKRIYHNMFNIFYRKGLN